MSEDKKTEEKWQERSILFIIALSIVSIMLIIWSDYGKFDFKKSIEGSIHIGDIKASGDESYYHWKRYKKNRDMYNMAYQGLRVANMINYRFLHFDMGKAGEKLLDDLLALKAHPQHELMAKKIAEVRKYDSWAEYQKATDAPKQEDITIEIE